MCMFLNRQALHIPPALHACISTCRVRKLEITKLYVKGQGSHASVAECTLAPLFIRVFAGSTDRESVIACIVCRDGPVFTLVGVLCAGSFQNGDTLDFDFYMASSCELWASAIVPGR